ncbi:variant erythrocyte surface antigen-1 family protein [Babesia caballi]|uniref:Variant erythrocyte surface antigen-1 family protein n=1 Tax=Babesia caballi TaxID=5871 RepID=A0AAV4LVY8_BABCB|nr:variant erythrocyte surface antigen-1 family protein [Babesia caballi]
MSAPSTSKSLTDCPSNLKEAIDWILRVTGKDGGTDNGGTDALTEQVKNLLSEVAGADPKLGAEIERVTQALGNGGLIGKLAEGLQQFIGYSNGTIKYANSGIGLYNDPLERLRTGVLVFVYGMITKLKEGKYLDSGQAETAIATIKQGKANFNKAVEKELKLTANGNSNFQNVLNAVKKVTDFKGKSTYSQLAETFKTYLGNVLKAVVEDSNVSSAKITSANDVKNLVTELKNKFENVVGAIKSQNPNQPIDFGKTELKQHIDKIYNGSDGTFKKL